MLLKSINNYYDPTVKASPQTLGQCSMAYGAVQNLGGVSLSLGPRLQVSLGGAGTNSRQEKPRLGEKVKTIHFMYLLF